MNEMGHICELCGSKEKHLHKDCLQELMDRIACRAVAEERARLVRVFHRHGYYELSNAIEFEGMP